ncbi:Polyketide synthase dehydratase, partial [Dendrosporobacter quercicolus]
MKDALHYILSEVKSKRLAKTDALDLIRQFETKTITNKSSYFNPLLHQNTSNFTEQRFSSTFIGEEFFLTDHMVKGKKMLPGVAYLEMARAAVEQAAGDLEDDQTGIRLENVLWIRPIIAGEEPIQVHIGLFLDDKGLISFEIYTEQNNAEPLLHSQGSAVLTKVADIPVIDIKALQAQCNQSVLSPIQCYEAFRSMGLSYGASHQGIEKINLGTGQALAKLFLPSSVSDTQNQFVLHPSVMDAALQTSIGLLMGAENVNNHHPMKLFLPFALDKLEIIEKCTAVMWCWVRYSEGSKSGDKMQKVDIDLCDEQGNVCVRLKGFSARSPEGET